MLTVLGGLAEFERELIRARTGEGRKLARSAVLGSAVPGAYQRQETLARLNALTNAVAKKTSNDLCYILLPLHDPLLRRLAANASP